MNNRSYALDALRGYAIITMVLSGTIVSGIMPGWMSHAQTPPPSHIFNPDIPGITWVDLVFPFFLFAMGAAFPFFVNKRIEKGETTLHLIWDVAKRYIQLTFFAIFIQHFYPWTLSNPQDPRAWLLALTCFALLFPMFMRMPFKMPEWAHIAVKLGAYLIAFILLNTVTYANDRKFDPHYSNIIILLLANMAFFGTAIYIFTRNNVLARLAVLPLIMGVFLGSKIEGSYTEAIFNFTPLGWMYKFTYLKYLFIVIPGSIAGEYIYRWMQERKKAEPHSIQKKENTTANILLLLTIGSIIVNLICLYNRWLTTNLLINIIVLVGGSVWLKLKKGSNINITLWQKLYIAGAYLILLGLIFEPFEGGIKKDHSTYSYYFVTAGLAFMAMLAFNIICDYYRYLRGTAFLYMSGQNPMIAYVATSLFTMPVLNLLGIRSLLEVFWQDPWMGFLHGVILTGIAVLITMFFTRIKWFWRT